MEDSILKELNDVFEDIKDKDTLYERLADGEYLAVIEDVIVGESKTGKPMVTIVFEVTNGPKEGKQHRKFLMLSGKDESQLKQNLHRFATEMKKLGVDTSKGLQYTLEQVVTKIGLEVKLTIETTVNKSGSEWFNTSFEIL